MQINWKSVSKALAAVVIIDEVLCVYHARRANRNEALYKKAHAEVQKAYGLAYYYGTKIDAAEIPLDDFDKIAIQDILA